MRKIDNINIGDKASLIHKITIDDINKFVDLTGDDNKLHINPEFAKKTEFKKPVVHGMLGASFISTIIGTKLPGDGALWYSQSLDFLRPVRVDDTIRIESCVISKNHKNNSIELKTSIYNQYNQIVTKGVSKIKLIEPIIDVIENKPNSKKKNTILVLGASGGIGSEVSKKLIKEGYDLVLHYHNNKKPIDDLIKIFNTSIKSFKVDLLNEVEVVEFGKKIKRLYPDLYGFVNCSTVQLPNVKFEDLNWELINHHININIKSNFYILKELMPIFTENKKGKIIFIGSQVIDSPTKEWLHYNISKSALASFMKSLAIEYSSNGININMVSPSLTDTDLVADLPLKAKLLVEAKTPLKRLCNTKDISEAILFLISDKSNFITGETIRLNGGQSMI